MRTNLLFIFCLLSFANVLMAQDKRVIDKVVAVVGQELVLLSDVEEQYSLATKSQQELPPNYKCYVLNEIMAQNLLLNQARLDSIIVTPDEIESQLDARFKQILQYMGGDEKQFEDYYGASINEMRSKYRIDLENQMLIERMQNQIIADATVTPAEVKEFFAQIPTDSLPFFNSEVEIAEIVIFPSRNEEEKSVSKALLEDLRQQIVAGGDFAALAKKYSDDLGSGAQGGELGWASRGSYVNEFEATAYNLEKGELSEVIETEFGFHILELMDRRGNTIKVRHILITPDITSKDEVMAREKLDSVKNLILYDSLNFEIAVKRFSDEDAESYNNGGNLVNNKSGNTFFEIGDLDPDIYFTIDTMDVGQVSSPFEFTNPRGEKGYKIVKLRSRTQPHRASLEQDYSKIKAAALASKKSKFIQEWIAEKIEQTYIELDPQQGDCEALQKWTKVKP